MAEQKQTKNIRDIIREEYVKCAKDPIYFMKKYVKIQHPMRGTLPFLTYKFQDDTLADLIKYDQNIILKSRQMGITTLVAAYALWLMIFHDNKEIICLSITQETSKAIVTKVRFANDNLPSWLKRAEAEDNRLSLKLSNGSKITAISSAGHAGRSGAASLLIIDEAAFIEKIEEIWLSSQYTLATGGKAIVLSTPNGVGNWFHKMWTESEAGKNSMNRITLPWHLHPERDQEWRDEQTKLSGEKGAAQECDCEFSTSGNTVVDIPILQWYEKTHMLEPVEKRGIDKGLWIFKYPEAGKSYMVAADVARGDGKDFNGAHVISLDDIEQIAEYNGKLSTGDYARMLVTMAIEYNNALLVIENNSVGWAVIQAALDIGYPNLFYSSGDIQYVDTDSQMTNKINAAEKKMVPGFATTPKSRPLLISKLESYIRNKECIIRSKRLLDELNVFIWKTTAASSAKAEAMTGYNDDLVLAFAIGMWIRDTALRLRGEAETITKTIISKIGSTSKEQIEKNTSRLLKSAGNNPYGIYHNPWEMQVGGPGSGHKPIDLKWLL